MKTSFTVSAAILLFLPALHSAQAEELTRNGGFEEPIVQPVTPGEQGNAAGKSLWKSFIINSDPAGGAVTAGVSGEIARSGTQSFFVKFDNVSLSYQNAALQTVPVSVMPAGRYRVSLWGRVDKKNPLAVGERPAYLKVQIEFFKEDGATPAGEPEYRIQPIPGSRNRDPIFTPDKWSEFFMEITTPAEAAFLVLNLSFETGSSPGKTNGVIYFDDFSINGASGGK
jgi:hypothetical protein